MRIAKANEILSLYGVQIRKQGNEWHIASLNATDNGEVLWGYLGYKGYTKDVLIKLLNNMDTVKRIGW